MTRNEEYQALLNELELTPPALDGTVGRALRRRRRDRRVRIFGIPAGSLAACFLGFVLLVNLFPPFARACGNVPVLRALAQAVAWSPSLSAAVEHDYVQPMGQSQTVNNITATIEYVIVDQKQVNIFLTLGGEGYETLTAEMPEFTPDQKCAVLGADTQQAPGTLLHFTLDYQDNSVPEGFTMAFGVTGETAADASAAPAEPSADRSLEDEMLEDVPEYAPDILATFTFDLAFDPTYTARGETVPVNSTFQLDGQTLTVTEAEVYPTHVRVNVEGAADNTAWLEDLDFYLENEDGERFDSISNGVSATGDPDTPSMKSFRLESPYFADSAHLTLHITGATWLDKEKERVRADLKAGTVEWLPEGVSVQSMQHRQDGWVLTFDVTAPADAHKQVFASRYYGEDGTEYDMDRFGWSFLDDGHGEAYLPLRGYEQDTVWLELSWSHASQAETPVTIPIK